MYSFNNNGDGDGDGDGVVGKNVQRAHCAHNFSLILKDWDILYGLILKYTVTNIVFEMEIIWILPQNVQPDWVSHMIMDWTGLLWRSWGWFQFPFSSTSIIRMDGDMDIRLQQNAICVLANFVSSEKQERGKRRHYSKQHSCHHHRLYLVWWGGEVCDSLKLTFEGKLLDPAWNGKHGSHG